MSVGRRVAYGGLFSYGTFIASKGLWYLSTLVLARLLVPSEFGLVGYGLIVISYLDVVKDLGVTSALIYRQDMQDDDANSAFTLNLVMGLFFFALCWVLSPFAALFFHDPRVVTMTRVLGFTFVLSGLGGVHSALLQKRLRFGRSFLPDLAQGVVKGGVSVALAWKGYGYWSLVWGQLAGVMVTTVANWILLPWRPRLRLRRVFVGQLLGYGLNISLLNLLGAVISSGDYVIIGHTLGKTPLALYTIAYTLPQMLTISLSAALSKVTFPTYAGLQGDRRALGQGYLTVLKYSALILVPVGLGLAVTAPAFLHMLYKPAWWPALPALQALSLYATLYALSWNDGDVYKAIGRTDVLWKLALVHAAVLLPALVIGAIAGGFVGVAVAQIVVAVPNVLGHAWLIRRVIGVPFAGTVAALRAPLLAGAALVIASLVAGRLLGAGTAPGLTFLLQVLAGGVAYVITVLLLSKDLRTRAALLVRRSRAHASMASTIDH